MFNGHPCFSGKLLVSPHAIDRNATNGIAAVHQMYVVLFRRRGDDSWIYDPPKRKHDDRYFSWCAINAVEYATELSAEQTHLEFLAVSLSQCHLEFLQSRKISFQGTLREQRQAHTHKNTQTTK
jgi:hypothetical protein